MQSIYLNDLSFSCASQNNAIELFLESFNEVLIALGESPRACFFHKHESIREIKLGDNITYNDVLDSIKNIDRDIYSVLIEFEDKNYQELSDMDIKNYISKIKNPFIPGLGSQNVNDLDLILLASCTHSILMSLNTSVIWAAQNITIHYYEDDQCSIYKSIDVGNISQRGHGKIWIESFSPKDLEWLPSIGNYTIKIFSRDHGLPHFHLCHRGNKLASIDIETFETIVGRIPNDRCAYDIINLAKKYKNKFRSCWKNNAQPSFIT